MTRAGRSSRRIPRLPLLLEQLFYRFPMAVVEIHAFSRCRGGAAYSVCPRCGATMEREYMSFCSRCGQRLDWRRYQQAKVIYVEPGDYTVRTEH